MKKLQWGINLVVLYMFIVLFVWPTITNYVFSISDTSLPDEVVSLDAEITERLATAPDNFSALYENLMPLPEYDLSFFTEDREQLPDYMIYGESLKSIVYVNVEQADGSRYFGSGSIITPDGVVMTNDHVIEGAVRVLVTTSEGEHYEVSQVLAADPDIDIAFLKLAVDPDERLHPLTIGNTDDLLIGDRTFVIGHPEGFINSLSIGNVAAFRDYRSQDRGIQLQLTNPISEGSSGGAVLNEYGELIGVPSWTYSYDANLVQVQNLNFAVSIDEALALLGVER